MEFDSLCLLLLTASSGGALGLAVLQRRRASMMGAATAMLIAGVNACITVFQIEPLSTRWAEAGWGALPPFAIALYGIASAMTWRYSHSPGSLRAAIACLAGTHVMGYALFASTMREMKQAIEQATPADQAIMWQGSFGEAVRIMEIGGIVSVVTALILLVSLGAPRPPVPLSESAGARAMA